MNAFTQFFATVFGGWFDRRLWTSVGSARTTTAHVDVSEDTALNYAAVWCATRLLCGTGASLPFPVYRSADGETREKFRTHRVHRLLNIAPNPEQTAFNFRSVMWQWQVNWGNAYAEIVREGGQPDAPIEAIWPIHPSRMKVCRYADGALYYEFRDFGAQPEELQPWQVLHLPSIITHDGVVGRGVIEHARETIGAGIAAEKKAANWFGGAGVPAIVVEHTGKANPEVRAAFRKEWKEIYGSPDGDQVALLQGGMTAKPLSFNAQDSQFLESRQFDVEEIARWYGIPPHLLQHLLRATFNNIEELGIDFVRYCLNLWLEIWEQAVHQKLFTEEEQDELFAEHNVDALLRGNAQARANLYQAMTNLGIMNRNECRKLENLDPVPGGDTYLVQGAMVPLDDSGKPESAFVNGGEAPASGGNETEEEPTEEVTAVIPQTLASSVQRIVQRDLTRFLTKETHKMTDSAKKPGEFVDCVENFYAIHRTTLVDVVHESVAALNDCGYSIDASALASAWASEGKAMMLEAAGAATAKELPEAVQRVIESKTWSERPLRAVERATNATPVV